MECKRWWLQRAVRELSWLVAAVFLMEAAAKEPWQNADEFVAWCETRTAECRSWRANLTQTVPNLPVPVEIRGPIIGRSPHLFRMDLVVPMFGKQANWLVVADNEGVVWQEINTGGRMQVIKGTPDKFTATFPIQGVPVSMPAMWELLRQLYDLKLHLIVEEAGQRLVVLDANPRDAGTAASSPEPTTDIAPLPLRLYIDAGDGWPRRVEVMNESGRDVIFRCELKNLRLNEPLSEDLFRYTPPPDVTVLELKSPHPWWLAR